VPTSQPTNLRQQPDSARSSQPDSNKESFQVSAPSISLPKGGGAIRGMGEKFAANPVTGTGSMTVPIATSPGRSGFGPQLSLSYDSGAGNGPFGFGWSLSLPSITRKTDKGLPKYQDADDSDVFILSGSEDLVPEFEKNAGEWVIKDGKHVVYDKPRTVNGVTYSVRRYRPRIEGLFARIERWTNQVDPKDSFWRSISKDNVTTWYGRSENSRIADPEDGARTFSWLICESYDGKGNVIAYRYKAEDSAKIDHSQVHERNRNEKGRSANRYLKCIRYGNHKPYLPELKETEPWPEPPGATAPNGSTDWFFEVVFDYGEHDANAPTATDGGEWDRRNDPFSAYRSGFEVRTYRLCQRVLMFHHFPEDEEVGADCLVRSTDFTYSQEQDPTDARNPIFSFLLSVSQSGYKRGGPGAYLKKSLPPLEFGYSEPNIDETVREVDPMSLQNLPVGTDGLQYQLLDLDGEGIQGVLSEQVDGWYYKRNVSPINIVKENGEDKTVASFEPLVQVSAHPSIAERTDSRHQFLDLAGDGQLDLVQFEQPVSGFFERMHEKYWDSFVPFESVPNLAWNDPNLKFIDLSGDGHADILITEHDALVWYPSLGEEGFGSAIRIPKPRDEEEGPAVVFADGTQAVFVADMSGDGLTDIVRICNGEVCYWPNLGYGRFGKKVTMDNAPWLDRTEIFDPRRIRLADIDGSGVTDIIYLSAQGIQIYFNQSGNGWSEAKKLDAFPRVDNLSSIQAMDLLGNGTACLVWTSPLPGEASRPMRYIDLMGGQKPHLLVKTVNNLGAETHVQYTPSTKFYLEDERDGKPWITRLPFPVHVVEKVTVKDKWRNTEFSSTYSYHHGYYDGIEREFRGFGRVDQVDVESFDKFAAANADSPYVADDNTLYQPPVKTVTWFHTGAFLDRARILSEFANESNVLGNFKEHELAEPDLNVEDLSVDESRQAFRACKGMTLRQETYELDVDALHARGEHLPVKLFSTACHNCHIQRLQPQEHNRHAVFLATESEAITYHYELDLRPNNVSPDPRVAHTLNLKTDEYGNVLQSIAVVYPRLGHHIDDTLPVGAEDLVSKVQRELHLSYRENRFTNDVDDADEPDDYRLCLPCEVMSYELTGVGPEDAEDETTPDIIDNRYFTMDELRAFRLSDVHQVSGTPVADIDYHKLPNGTMPQKRLVEHVRTLYFKANLQEPEPFRTLNHLGITYETYKLALTGDLLNAVFGTKLTPDVQTGLDDHTISGYLSGVGLTMRFGSDATAGQYWIRSGVAGFEPDAPQHFYLPERYTNPFDEEIKLKYSHDLFVESSTDPVGNTVAVQKFDFRVLAPREIKDINENLSEVRFDVLGMPTAMAVKGKGNEGDNVDGFDAALVNPELTKLISFFTGNYEETAARGFLGNVTARYLYYLGEKQTATQLTYGNHPPCAAGILREKHVAQLGAGEESAIQSAFEYSDGMGTVLVKKVQAEPAPGDPINKLRWVASGKTVLNNKGKPVKQYDPYFSVNEHRFEEPAEIGVTPVMYYDAAGRLIRTEIPDGSFSKVEFSPWHITTYDQNDTAFDPDPAKRSDWYRRRQDPMHPRFGEFNSAQNARAAELVEMHANTPTTTFLDSLGRDVISVAHNKYKDAQGTSHGEKYVTFTKLDAEGKPLWIRDARKNLVMQYITPPVANNQTADPQIGFVPCYDIAGNLLFQHSMDAGDRWMLNDAVGKALYAWDSRGHRVQTKYDQLRRPTELFVLGGDDIPANQQVLAEKIVYGESQGHAKNHRGKIYQHFDGAGVITNVHYDFKGNLVEANRKLVKEYKKQIDWNNPPADEETFTSKTHFDALNRPVLLITPHNSNIVPSEIRPVYNEASLLNSVQVKVRGGAEKVYVKNIDYNAKGQRFLIEYGNDVKSEYAYDEETFRLLRLRTNRKNPPFSGDCPEPPPDGWPGCGIQNLHYTYDAVGNITHIEDKAQQKIFFDNQRVEPSNDYVYDAIYRLIEAEGREHAGQSANNRPEHRPELKPYYDFNDSTRMSLAHPNDGQAMRNYTEKYEYDEVGNFLKMIHEAGPGGTWARRYDSEPDSNRLRSTNLPGDPAAGPLPAHYEYNAHGSMTKMPHLSTMRWNFKDELSATSLQVTNAGTPETTYYVYDASGQRVRKVTEGQNANPKNERIYVGGFEIYREYGTGTNINLQRETLHVMDGQQRIALVETRTQGNDLTPPQLIRYQFGNHLGSANLELDHQAQIISYEEYTPYGSPSYHAVRSQTETPKRYRYTGKERDDESGLYYHGARYYAPWISGWISADRVDSPQPRNLYSYVLNNPCRFIDPDGADEKEPKDPGGSFMPSNQSDFGTLVHTIVLKTMSARLQVLGVPSATEVETLPDGSKNPNSQNPGSVDLALFIPDPKVKDENQAHLYELKPRNPSKYQEYVSEVHHYTEHFPKKVGNYVVSQPKIGTALNIADKVAPQLFDPIVIRNGEYEATINIALAKDNNGATIPGLIVYDLSARRRRPNEEQNQVQNAKNLLKTKPYQTVGSQIMMEHRLDIFIKVAKNVAFSVGYVGGGLAAKAGIAGAVGTTTATGATAAAATATTAGTGATVTVLGAGTATTEITSLAASVLLYFQTQSGKEEKKSN
jgi:RHS repeat-associated protein